MASAAISAAEAVDSRAGVDPGTVAQTQTEFREWLEAFVGSPISGDEASIDAIAALIATAEPDALDLLGERLHELLVDLVSVAHETGEDICVGYFASIEGVISAIDDRLAQFD